MSAIWFLDLYQATSMSTARSSDPYCQYEVWSLLSTLEAPYRYQKNFTYQNHIWTETFVTKFFCATHPTRGSLSKNQYESEKSVLQPLEGRAKSKIFTNNSGSPYEVLASKIFFGALQTDPDPEIQISGSGSVHRAPKKLYLPKSYMGCHFCF